MAQRVRLRAPLVEAARRAIAKLGGAPLVCAALAGEPPGPRVLWAAGKAAPAMARGAAEALGDDLIGGLVIARAPLAGETAPAPLQLFAAAHPFPDERSVRATDALLDAARRLGKNERAIFCLSGGASSLLGAPLSGLPVCALATATRALLDGGAPIGEINIVRRHLGRALGGRLAQASAGELEVLALSDVIGDDPAAIGSGPASPDPSTLDNARAIARQYRLSTEIEAALARAPETIKPGDPCFSRVRYRLLASPRTLLDAAAAEVGALGLQVAAREELVTGSVEIFAGELEARAAALAPGEAFVAVGEPTVRVRGDGKGGRAQHLALLVAGALAQSDRLFLALGSDGSDGPTEAAGAIVDGDTYCPESEQALARFDAYSHLSERGCAIVTGPTGTNLTDLFVLARAPG